PPQPALWLRPHRLRRARHPRRPPSSVVRPHRALRDHFHRPRPQLEPEPEGGGTDEGMATFEDAEAARKAHQDRLAALGAHAIEIQMLDDLSGYEMIVHFAEQPPTGD